MFSTIKKIFSPREYIREYIREIAKEVILELLKDDDINKEYKHKKISLALDNPRNLNTKFLKFLKAQKRIEYFAINFEYYDNDFYLQEIKIREETLEELIKKAKSVSLPDDLKSVDFHMKGVSEYGSIRDYIGYQNIHKHDYYPLIDNLEKFIKDSAPEYLL